MLYGAGRYFLCRNCYDLNYASQHENRRYRLLRKAQKIRARLGASPDIFEPIFQKPKGMHWTTFHRLKEEADFTNMVVFGLLGQYLDTLERNLSRSSKDGIRRCLAR